jgi:hypothetical protein
VALKAAGLFVAALVVGLIALVVSRRDDPPSSQQPARSASTEVDNVFADLRARPLRKPRLRKGAFCPDPGRGAVGLPPWFPAEGALGTGAVHAVSKAIPRFLDFFPDSSSGEWRSNETPWLSDPTYDGPLLVRGGQVHGGRRFRFGSGDPPTLELRLPAGPWDEMDGRVRVWDGKSVQLPEGWRAAMRPTRVRDLPDGPGPSCYFLQFDGDSFSESVLVGVLIQP